MRQAMRFAWTLAAVLFAVPALGDEAPATTQSGTAAQASPAVTQAKAAPQSDQGGSSEEAVRTGAPGMEPGDSMSQAKESREDRNEREFAESVWTAP
jgi:hypothetical protein